MQIYAALAANRVPCFQRRQGATPLRSTRCLSLVSSCMAALLNPGRGLRQCTSTLMGVDRAQGRELSCVNTEVSVLACHATTKVNDLLASEHQSAKAMQQTALQNVTWWSRSCGTYLQWKFSKLKISLLDIQTVSFLFHYLPELPFMITPRQQLGATQPNSQIQPMRATG